MQRDSEDEWVHDSFDEDVPVEEDIFGSPEAEVVNSGTDAGGSPISAGCLSETERDLAAALEEAFCPSPSDGAALASMGVASAPAGLASGGVASALAGSGRGGAASAQAGLASAAPGDEAADGAPQPAKPRAKKKKKMAIKATASAAAAGAESAASRRGRPLKRRASGARPDDLQCVSRLCLQGGDVKAPAVIHPLVKHGDKVFTPIHERLYWLRRACAEQGTTHWTERFQHAVSELRRVLKEGLLANTDVVGQAARKAKEALGLEDEDVELPSGKKPRKRTAALPQSMAEAAVTLGGCTLNLRVHERPFEIEATPEAVMAIVRFCQERLQDDPIVLKKDQKREASAEGAPAASAPSGSASAPEVAASAAGSASASSSGFRLGAADCPARLGKVTWHPSVRAWAVHYKDKSRKTHQRRVSVRLPKASGSGSFLESTSPEDQAKAWAEARRSAYVEAINLWNELDHSTRERIELPSTSGP